MEVRNCLLIVFVLACMTTDLLYGKIFNGIVLPAAVLGLTWHAWLEGPEGLMMASIAVLLTMVLFCPVWRMTEGKGIGAGDIKLLAAIAAILPTEVLLTVAMVTFGSAAICGIIKVLSGKGGGLHLAVYAAFGTLLHVGGLY